MLFFSWYRYHSDGVSVPDEAENAKVDLQLISWRTHSSNRRSTRLSSLSTFALIRCSPLRNDSSAEVNFAFFIALGPFTVSL